MALFGPPDVVALEKKHRVRSLVRLLGKAKHKLLHVRVADALGRLGDPRAVAPLLAAWPGADAELQEAILEALVPMNAPQAADVFMVTLEGASQPSLRILAAKGLGGLRLQAAARALRGALGHADSRLRAAAAASLGEVAPGDAASAECVIAALGDEDGAVRAASAGAIVALNAARPALGLDSFEPVVGLASTPAGVNAPSSVMRALGGAADSRALAPLLRGLGSRSELVRMAAAKALGELGKAIPDLGLEALANTYGIAEPLSLCGDPRACACLLARVKTEMGGPVAEVRPLVAALQTAIEAHHEVLDSTLLESVAALGAVWGSDEERVWQTWTEDVGDKWCAKQKERSGYRTIQRRVDLDVSTLCLTARRELAAREGVR